MVDLFNLDAKCAAAELAAIKAQKELDAFIDTLDDDTVLVGVDCHI